MIARRSQDTVPEVELQARLAWARQTAILRAYGMRSDVEPRRAVPRGCSRATRRGGCSGGHCALTVFLFTSAASDDQTQRRGGARGMIV